MLSSAATRRLLLLGAALAALGPKQPARAVEYFDGRIQAHGFFEERLVAIRDDFDDDTDLAQWAHVFNLEIEADLAPDGLGPFDLIGAYARITAAYDCVWTRACGLFPSADSYGDRAHKLPARLSNAERNRFSGVAVARGREPVLPDHRLGTLRSISGFSLLFETSPENAQRVFGAITDYGFAFPAAEGGLAAGPWRPEDRVNPVATLAGSPNPLGLNPDGMNPVREQQALQLPFRPAPLLSVDGPFDRDRARGLYYPYPGLPKALDEIDSHAHDQNFRQAELEWNRGASQQDEKELKEAYLDVELLEGALWARIGKQTIVWGKTELFRNQDRWNPQDIGLGPLAALEESRIGLWSARAIYSFYDVGPLDDVRVETAVLLEPFEPTDIGMCGEPLVPTIVCGKRFGLMAHGAFGLGLAGERSPPAPWNSTRGIEAGLRLEWRWSRFSFAVTDFWGYRDLGFTEKIFTFERNVDPRTGRPRRALSRAGCDPGGLFDGDESGCLGVRPFDVSNLAHRRDVLRHHPANQQLFSVVCAATLGTLGSLVGGASSFLPTHACAIDAFNSRTGADGFNAVAADAPGAGLVLRVLTGGTKSPSPDELLAPLHSSAADGSGAGVSGVLTEEQQALLGCGPFFGTICDSGPQGTPQGPDFLNAEASVLFQSFAGFEGNPARGYRTDRGPQPGTLGFDGGPVATRFVDGRLRILPGARRPFDDAYDPAIDGCVASMPALGLSPARDPRGLCSDIPTGSELRHPGTGALFANELAALSWNFQMMLVLLSGESDDPATPEDESAARDAWDGVVSFAGDPDPDRCSIVAPQYCSLIRGLLSITGVRRSDRRAAGNGRFGRRDFRWHGGTPVVWAYEKANVLGFAADFAEDFTKTNWGLEATWENDIKAGDADRRSGLSEVDVYNLTISMDRPTIIDFLNPNRSFFINTQWFVTYVDGYRESFGSNGPFNVLGTLTAFTGYFQDRLSAAVTLAYDFESNSGAVLYSAGYRFSERFRVSLGVRTFFGRLQSKKLAINPLSLSNQRGADADRTDAALGIAPVRDLDQVFLRLRYTF